MPPKLSSDVNRPDNEGKGPRTGIVVAVAAAVAVGAAAAVAGAIALAKKRN